MNLPIKIQEIKHKLTEKLGHGYSQDISTRFDYNYRNGKIHFYISTSAGPIINVEFDAMNQEDMNPWVDQIVQKVLEYKENRQKLLLSTAEAVNTLKREETKFKFTEHKFGACSNPSLGNMRYTWLCLNSPKVHDQWCKLYVNSDCTLNKEHTAKSIVTLRSSPYETINNKIPPKVAIVLPEIEPAVYEYISSKPEILETAYKLPLNKTKMREDTEYVIALLKEENNKLAPLEAGEMLNPTLTLWMAVMLRYSPYGRKLDGWAKKIDEDQIKEITRISGHTVSYDKNTIFMNKVLYNSWYCHDTDLNSYNIGGVVSEKDEYINYLLDTAIVEYLKKIK